ncbi:hypothetical protein E2562_038055 [Oryza meyeriana var. granulata]|uniref:Uncharacterized protein n=1 Tax=Oryza meyeriana var. granulata TaxID=110450 RepID=A0A6G1EU19_9ORYZ|nr:hypothetical protein E2562_038055 [Oryza meyeriana var. granulata]
MASTNGKGEVYVKEGSKLYSRMMSKEAAAAALAVPSFRVYYGVASAGSVPFLWESQPGTPKSSPSTAVLPPLTPPPSYYASGGKGAKKGGAASSRWHGWSGGRGVFGAIFPRIGFLRRPWRRTSRCSSSSASSSSWSYSSPSSVSMSPVFTVHQASPAVARSHHRRAFSAGGGYDVDEAAAAARCFGVERECERGLVKGCGVAVAVRNALSTVVGHKSGGRGGAAAAAY